MLRTLGSTAVQHFKARLRGELISADDVRYDQARHVWNGQVDKYPSLIVRCLDSTDVLNSIELARQQDMAVAVRSGGHSLAGHSVCDGGLVIDLSGMNRLWVDPVTRTAHAQAGLVLGRFVFEAQRHGLATTTGTVAGTGLAGLTLGGGIGWLMGIHGLTIDNMLSADLVTAEGQLLTASADEHAELFWGLRGGGGNFGIVTSFDLQLHPVGPVLAGKIVYPLEKAREVLRLYREYTSTAPDELTAYAAIRTTPSGIPTIAISLCYSGPLERGEQLVEPLRKFCTPLADYIRVKPYFKAISNDEGTPAGRHYVQRATSFNELSDEAIDIISEYSTIQTSPMSHLLLQHIHGAASRVAPTATAFALRNISYVMNIVAAWDVSDPHEVKKHIEWVHSFQAALQPFTAPGVYSNFLDDEGEERVRASYDVNYERLVALKNKYDPTNFFQFNQNIKPTL